MGEGKLTDIQKLNCILKHIRSEGIKVRIYQDTRRKDSFPNGTSHRYTKKIYIYCQKISLCPNLVAAMLIHEYGHCLLDHVLYETVRYGHTEREAWDTGKKYIPENCVPTNFKGFMNYCLDSYDEVD